MTKRVTHRARVADKTSDHVWFALDDSGIEVPIPFEDPNQSSAVEQSLDALRVGDCCRATMVATNEQHIAWYIDSISVLSAAECP